MQKKVSVVIGVVLAILVLTSSGQRAEDTLDKLVRKFTKEKKLVPLDTMRALQNPAHVALGKELFRDVRLSRNNNISCATCHIDQKGFSNGEAFSKGTHGETTTRHVPHLYNQAWQLNFFWDGRAVDLEDQFKAVVSSKAELDMTVEEIVAKLRQDSLLTRSFNLLFPSQGLNKKTLATAIISYEKSLHSGWSRYDRFVNGDTTALNIPEKKGLTLFLGKANCISCHFGQNLSDGLFHNVGVITEDKGRHMVEKIGMANEFESRPYPFFSNFKAFKTPTLRNLSFTAPYFHNGSKATLREVLVFYNTGGDNPDRTGVAKELKPLHLTEEELDHLEAFLNSLRGTQ